MNEIQKAFAALFGITLLRTTLSMILPQGTIKRFAEYAFSLVQAMIMLQWCRQALSALMGAWK